MTSHPALCVQAPKLAALFIEGHRATIRDAIAKHHMPVALSGAVALELMQFPDRTLALCYVDLFLRDLKNNASN